MSLIGRCESQKRKKKGNHGKRMLLFFPKLYLLSNIPQGQHVWRCRSNKQKKTQMIISNLIILCYISYLHIISSYLNPYPHNTSQNSCLGIATSFYYIHCLYNIEYITYNAMAYKHSQIVGGKFILSWQISMVNPS